MSSHNQFLSQTIIESHRARALPEGRWWWWGSGLGKKKVLTGPAQAKSHSRQVLVINGHFNFYLTLEKWPFPLERERPVTRAWPADISRHVVTSGSSEQSLSSLFETIHVWWQPALPRVTHEVDLSPLEHVPLSSLRSTFFSKRETVKSYLYYIYLHLFYNKSNLQYLISLKCIAMSIHLDRNGGDI